MLPIGGAASTHIIKPASDRLLASVENELLCMRLAAALGLPTAEVSYGEAEGRPDLLVQRYDRSIGEDGLVRRSHEEDFCQALGRYPTEKYRHPAGRTLKSSSAA